MRSIVAALVALAMFTATACTTTAVLDETTPVRLSAAPPPPPEPAPEPEPPPRVEVEAERIRVDEKIHFEIDSAEIDPRSDDLLEEIAQVLDDNPHVKKVRIEGHTDNDGEPAYNMSLSERRAQSVMARLVENGVDADRLVAEGYGLTQPIETNETVAGRAANRRVEFDILEQDPTTTQAAGEVSGQVPEDEPGDQAQAPEAQEAGPTGRAGVVRNPQEQTGGDQ